MRKALENIGSNERHRFRGEFVRYGWKNGYRGEEQTILLQHIVEVKTGKEVTDHLWFNATKGFVRLDPQPGDILEFDARVACYLKGYMGYRDDVYCPISEDYKLSFPTRIENLTHPENNEKAKQKRTVEIQLERERKANEVPKAERHDPKKDPPTQRQLEFIGEIAKGLEKPVPEVKTKEEASEWIDQYIDAFSAYSRRQKYLDRVQKAKDLTAEGLSDEAICQRLGIKTATLRKYKREWTREDNSTIPEAKILPE